MTAYKKFKMLGWLMPVGGVFFGIICSQAAILGIRFGRPLWIWLGGLIFIGWMAAIPLLSKYRWSVLYLQARKDGAFDA